ncbi:MAG: hypothetical protein M1453_06425 [Acidobacteria bacterium]|nr:hypothetical protein [Acidobacteriota bacterium]MCL5287612.1 hypothetical protein [Acidobacteriota bacterium]
MNSKHSRAIPKSALLALPLLLGALLFFPFPALAQGSAETQEGVNSGNYNIKQTFEFGYRWTDFTGSRSVYNTLVNLNQGPRLFEHSLEMRSLNHQGLLFDNFSLHSFGYGGDPNNVTRLRIYKNKWYNFNATFRRDRNFWDYNLLANPLNPNSYVSTVPAGTPIFNVPFSPHRMEITRRMSDFSLVLAPQNPIRVRLGYSRNVSQGPSLTTFHEGTDVFLVQNWANTLNSYQIGVDFKLLPKTNISFDQFFHFYKSDTTFTDPIATQLVLGNSSLARPLYQLSNGQLVDPGAIFNFNASTPCASTVTSPFITNAATTPPTIKAACNGYLRYDRAGNVRTLYPTSQLSFQTSYFRNFDISGRLSYSNSTMDLLGTNAATGYQGALNFNGLSEFYQGLVQRTNQRQFATSGPADGKRYNVTGDFAVTWYVSDKLRFTDVFRYDRFRIPGFFDMLELSLFPVNPAAPQPAASLLDPTAGFVQGSAPPATCPTATSVGCPRHVSSSPADLASELFRLVLKQRTVSNHFEVAYDFNKHFGGSIAYRFRNRKIVHSRSESVDLTFFPTLPNRGGCTPGTTAPGFTATNLPDGSCRLVGSDADEDVTDINEHAGLFGLWLRPNNQWRITYDMELMSADHVFTRISPRQYQRYKFRANYKPVQWANISGLFNIYEHRNNVFEILHTQHNRTYAFAVVLAPNEKWSVDFGYDYNDVQSNTNICYTIGAGPLPPGSTPCPVGTLPVSGVSRYRSKTHYGYGSLMWRPVRRLTTSLGYMVNSVNGDTTFLSPNAPVGPLRYNYHKPYAGLEIELNKNMFFRSNWGYYGYNEKAAPDLTTAPRDFRGNLFTTSVRFAF